MGIIVQIVRPSQSTPETQPKLQLALPFSRQPRSLVSDLTI
jgi:hypothetical protein